jgi:methionyl aminopeptidase
MSVETEEELQALKRAGRVVAAALGRMRRRVQPGVTTSDLDEVAAGVLHEHGARPAPQLTYGFPGTACISVNDEAVHGVPGPRRLAAGDLVTLDVTVELDGYYADAAVTVGVPPVEEPARRLIEAAEAAFRKAARLARAGERLARLGGAIETETRKRGFHVLRELCGHGIGRSIHEQPSVNNFYDPLDRYRLTRGLVIALEPIISAGGARTRTGSDGWTISSADGSLTAHHEHTIVITDGSPLILTAA